MSTVVLNNDVITVPTLNVSARHPKAYKAHALDHILQQTEFPGAAFCLKTEDPIADSEANRFLLWKVSPS
jgi:hypothetical protein